jgi:hypothetical protein
MGCRGAGLPLRILKESIQEANHFSLLYQHKVRKGALLMIFVLKPKKRSLPCILIKQTGSNINDQETTSGGGDYHTASGDRGSETKGQTYHERRKEYRCRCGDRAKCLKHQGQENSRQYLLYKGGNSEGGNFSS